MRVQGIEPVPGAILTDTEATYSAAARRRSTATSVSLVAAIVEEADARPDFAEIVRRATRGGR